MIGVCKASPIITIMIAINHDCHVKDNRPLLRGQWRAPGHLACWTMAAGWSPGGLLVKINGGERDCWWWMVILASGSQLFEFILTVIAVVDVVVLNHEGGGGGEKREWNWCSSDWQPVSNRVHNNENFSRVRGSIVRPTRRAGTAAGAMWLRKKIGFLTSFCQRGGQVDKKELQIVRKFFRKTIEMKTTTKSD